MKISRKEIKDFSGGVQTKTTSDMTNYNQVIHCLNGVFDEKIGGVIGRKGSIVKSTVGAVEIIDKLFLYRNGTTKKYIAVVNDGGSPGNKDAYVSATDDFVGAWSKFKEDLGLTANVNFENFATKMAIFDGVNTPKWWDGTTLINIANAPVSGIYPKQFEQRLFVLDSNSFLYYSDVVNSTGNGLTTDTWTSRGIYPNDGQTPKGLARHRGVLKIFKTESIFNYNGTNEPEPVINIGTHSGKSIVETDNFIFFHHPTGIWMMSSGMPTLISRRIQKYISGMSSANWENVSGGKDVNGNIYFWIGNVTITDPFEFDYGRTYTNVVLVYNMYSQNWTVFTGWNARTWFYDELTGYTYFGSENGKIYQINYAYAEVDNTNTTAIQFELILNPEDFGFPDRQKTVKTIFIDGEVGLGVDIGKSYKFLERRDYDPVIPVNGFIKNEYTLNELWLGVNQVYKDTPPYLKKIIIDDIELDER